MPSTVNEQIIDEKTGVGMNTVGTAGAWAMAQVYAAYPSHAAFMNLMTQKLSANVVEGKISVMDAVGVTKLIKGEAEASILGDLSQLDAGQIGQKTANTTPPETGNNSGAYAVQLASALAFLQAQSNGPSPVPAK